MCVFLRLNGPAIEAEEPDVVRMILVLAAGNLDELGLVILLRNHTVAA